MVFQTCDEAQLCITSWDEGVCVQGTDGEQAEELTQSYAASPHRIFDE